ncbi:MAG TPA: hypothetical protein VF081_03500 [Solirubrobacterales bacterium]
MAALEEHREVDGVRERRERIAARRARREAGDGERPGSSDT